MDIITRRFSKTKQYILSLLIVVVTAVLCYFIIDLIGQTATALILLLAVSLNAILFNIFPVLISALLSALILNFFFIPPILTFYIGTPEDGLMFLMYFVIASINAVLTYKVRQIERRERDEIEKIKAINLYNTLLNSLSHELRTPISTIIGAIDTIKDNNIKLSDANRHELYSEIEIAGFRLNRQVENLLSMSRLEAGFIQPKIDWTDLNELVFRSIKNNSEELKNFQVLFQPNESLPLFKIDGGLVEQILHNLIHNATQYTPLNSIIKIQLSHENEKCKIVLSDNGPGFPEEKINAVFDKFYRIDTLGTGGTGLGLSIVKGFTEAMNGTVELINLNDRGAQFTIEIPCETSFNTAIDNE